MSLTHPRDYETHLQQAFVIADFAKRRQMIQQQIQQLCQQQSVVAQVDEALLDEVTCIVEWPVAQVAQFDSQFLQVPAECLIAAMQDHQKSFPVMDADQHLLAKFIFIANIDSRDSARMVAGNEKVMRARLADAAFFYNADQQQTLADRVEATRHVVFQQALGSLFDKSQRLIALGGILATQTHADVATVERACTLAKCDLMTDMVGEFPELQGIMGYHYALLQGESVEVAQALREQYLPRFATDELPGCATGITLALAERIDTLVGIFGIGQAPTGDKDPFKLRRAALGIIRIIVAHELTMDLPQVLEAACTVYPDLSHEQTVTQVQTFILERAKVWLQHEQDVTADVIQAVIARQQCDVLDLTRRIEAVQEFCQLEQAQALAATNKRVSNLLTKQAKATTLPTFNREWLIEAEEIQLADHLQHIAQQVQPLCDNQQYTQAFSQLAQLQQPIDEFFDHVMVMADDINLRHNRLALLQQVRDLFWQIADVSLLQL